MLSFSSILINYSCLVFVLQFNPLVFVQLRLFIKDQNPLNSLFLQELKLNLDHPKLSGEKSVQNAITEVAAMMGENVKLRRGFAMSAPSLGVISTYLHTSPQPGRIHMRCLMYPRHILHLLFLYIQICK